MPEHDVLGLEACTPSWIWRCEGLKVPKREPNVWLQKAVADLTPHKLILKEAPECGGPSKGPRLSGASGVTPTMWKMVEEPYVASAAPSAVRSEASGLASMPSITATRQYEFSRSPINAPRRLQSAEERGRSSNTKRSPPLLERSRWKP